ncbi:hypothetical protein K438DRAFT_1805786, partial [Mycena galopus ATCC 62051]
DRGTTRTTDITTRFNPLVLLFRWLRRKMVPIQLTKPTSATILLALGNQAHNRKTLVPPAAGVLGSEARPRHGSHHPTQFTSLVLLFRWLRRKMVQTHFAIFGCVSTSYLVVPQSFSPEHRRTPSVIRNPCICEPRQSHYRLCKASRPNSCLFTSLPNGDVTTGFCLSSLTSTSARPFRTSWSNSLVRADVPPPSLQLKQSATL